MDGASRKILIATFGSLGDLHPFVALAHALQREGFAPVIATHEAYRAFLTGEGIDFVPMRPDADELTARLGMDLGEIARRMAADDAFLFNALIFPYLRASYDDLLAASGEAKLVVAHSLAFSARLVAEKQRLPLATVLLSPLMLYSAYDPPYGSRAPFIPGPMSAPAVLYNRALLWTLAHAMGFWAAPLRRIRRELKLAPRYGLDLLLGVKSSDAVIGLFSPTLAPPRSDHPPGAEIAGHSFHDRFIDGHALDPSLEAFLDGGAPPLVFTLGSFVARSRQAHYAACLEAANRLGCRAVLLTHIDDAPTLAAMAPDSVHVASYAPHSLVLPRACAVVHHGGIGTVGQALRAGKPQIVTPFLGDQFDNAERLRRLGVAQVVKGEETTADALSGALRAVLNDESVKTRAQALAAVIAKEDGAVVAAKRIAALLMNHVKAVAVQ